MDVKRTLLDGIDIGVEIYDEISPERIIGSEYFGRAAEEYEQAGLTQLAKINRQISNSEKISLGRAMTSYETDVWRWRYPTIYKSNGIHTFFQRDQWVLPWSQCEWPVPDEVRSLLLRALPAFDYLEIWTPELRQVQVRWTGASPILVGVRGSDRWLLARWAEALEPFEEIAKKAFSNDGLRAMEIRRIVFGFYPPILTSLTFALSITAGFSGIVGIAEHSWLVGALSIAFGVAASLCGYALYRRVNKHALDWACEYAGWVIRT